MRPLRPTAAAAAVALLLVLSVGGCTNADGVIRETPTPGTGTATPSLSSATPTPTMEEQRILAQYRGFFVALTPTSEAPAAQRRQLLEPYATDPVLTRTLSGMRGSDNLGQVGYGEEVVRPKITKIEGGVAYVRDCQDASRTGRKERDRGSGSRRSCCVRVGSTTRAGR
jgi:hypothetical protein